MAKFDSKIEKQGSKIKLQLQGVIDEDVDFSQLSLAGSSEVDLDLTGIKSINSCGIREWIKWLGTAPQAKVVYANCPKIIVDQINMVDGFLPAQGQVLSFFVPYYNEDSGSEKNILFRLGHEYSEGQVKPPTNVLDDQGQPMEMDIIESKYFKFIKK